MELEGSTCNVLRGQQDREGKTILIKYCVRFKERPRERRSVPSAFESEEKEVTGLRLVLLGHVDKWTVRKC